ncbi:hypothetical protein BJY04DRAFT_113776 [Aspergillus karnatakaensis]|uniref:uncharacterized protein n=1 Tax=Aspergillus karnatakaensis TaxID=1810916 RepID=UPI003CCDE336
MKGTSGGAFMTKSAKFLSFSYRSFRYICPSCSVRRFSSSRSSSSRNAPDPRLEDFGKVIRDEYAVIRGHYGNTDIS